MIDFGMAVKYDHGVWFKDMATKKTPHLFATGDVLEKVVGLMERNLYGIQGARNCSHKRRGI